MGAYNYKISEYAHGTKITNYSKLIYTDQKKKKELNHPKQSRRQKWQGIRYRLL